MLLIFHHNIICGLFRPILLKAFHPFDEKNLKKFGILTPLIEEPRVSVIDVNPYGKINATYDNEYLPVNIKFDSKQDLIKLQKILANRFNYPLKKESQINIQSPGIKITGIHSNTSPMLKIEKLKQ